MRTRDEGDLERLRLKYGDDIIKSIVKANVGSGMVENPAYNKGRAYFVDFRPLKHSITRLSDEDLQKYYKYNNLIDDLEYQLEQLEKLKVDVFDLKLELKLAADKVKTGNFNMVDIYLEGLKPRIDAEWQKIGKKPQKRKKELVDRAMILASVEQAKQARIQYENLQKSKSQIKTSEINLPESQKTTSPQDQPSSEEHTTKTSAGQSTRETSKNTDFNEKASKIYESMTQAVSNHDTAKFKELYKEMQQLYPKLSKDVKKDYYEKILKLVEQLKK